MLYLCYTSNTLNVKTSGLPSNTESSDNAKVSRLQTKQGLKTVTVSCHKPKLENNAQDEKETETANTVVMQIDFNRLKQTPY